jgi:hypothetical protein
MTDIHNGKFYFFWSGPFSNWYPSYFKMHDNVIADKDYGPLMFNCGEQYMVFKKAGLFEDVEIADKIMQSSDPKEIKDFGRLVKNFDVGVWEANAKRLIYPGLYEKFNQDPKLLKQLLDTGDKILVKASPYDTIWGIGLDEATALITPEEQWRGRNWLGELITEIKNYVRLFDDANPYE